MNNNNVLTSNKKLRVRDKGRLVIMLFSLVNVIVNSESLIFHQPCDVNIIRLFRHPFRFEDGLWEILVLCGGNPGSHTVGVLHGGVFTSHVFSVCRVFYSSSCVFLSLNFLRIFTVIIDPS
ncbi:hypothetical protein GE061_011913 [Apolygus lucorum]|uniref:Uncharacterized protein n=1 Tax=Apolygus lucorum TaxID=248454 RepID=A0A8S9XSW3_APOLU|nr:hypothetical protein GE061_011913 [Apolygus lucorum]